MTGSIFAFQYYQQQTSHSLEQRVGGLAITIDSKTIEKLHGNEDDISNATYLDLKKQLLALRALNTDTRFIYLMGQQNGQIFFYVDSEPDNSEDYSPPGQVYEEASALIPTIFADQKIKSEVSSDRWGTWLSYMAPIIDESTGQTVAVVGIDVTYQNYISSAVIFSMLPIAIGMIIIILLVMALVYARKEEEILRIRSEYFAIAAHDLRTPLTGIKWAMNTLSRLDSQELAKKCKTVFKQIDSSTENMLGSVNELLDSANLDKTNSRMLVPGKVEMNQLIKDSILPLKISADDKNIKVAFSESKPTSLNIDKDKIRRVISNIFSNAIKYSLTGGAIHITTKSTGNNFIISIKDNGIGIPAKEQDKIFSGYYRASNAKDFTTQGTGLGLYYAKNIIELHGGKITLHSQPDHGTDIIISLPIVK